MKRESPMPPAPRRKLSVSKRVLRTLWVLALYARDMLESDLIALWRNGRLFVGIALILLGLLSFGSSRYCDGNSSAYYTCTRSSTYYFYPWWAILLTILGSFLVVLWFLRRSQR